MWGLLAVLLLILGTGFFVAAEFAFVAVDRSRIDTEAAQRGRAARTVQSVLRRLSFYLSGAQLGITVTSLMLGFIAEPTIATLLQEPIGAVTGGRSARGVSVAVALILVTVASMVLSELVPKNLSIARPEKVAKALARPTRVYGLVFGPLITLLNGAANWTVRRLGIEPQEELASVRSLEELELLIRASGEGGAIDPNALSLLTRSIRFGDKTAADVLVPRLAVRAIPPDGGIGDLLRLSMETGFSRFLVAGEDLDEIFGVVHVKDVYRLPVAERAAAPVTTVMRNALFVPETRELKSLLRELREEGSHLAVVVDEFGSTAGIVTLEDILEELVGEIDDEYDRSAPEVVVAPAGTHILAGTLHADDVRDATGFEMPDGEYETVAGFVLDRLGRIPEPGDSFEHDGWTVEVKEMDRRRVASVVLRAPGRVRTDSRADT